jgi:hypothetical protein
MEKILNKLNFKKISPNNYYREDIGSFLLNGEYLIAFNFVYSFRIGSFNPIFDDLINAAKKNDIDLIIILDRKTLNSVVEYPDFFINILDLEKNKNFITFFKHNNNFFNNYEFNLFPYVDFKNNHYSLVRLQSDNLCAEFGLESFSFVTCFESNSFFDLVEMSKPTENIKKLFNNVEFMNEKESEQIFEYCNTDNLETNKIYCSTCLIIKEDHLIQNYCFLNYEGMNNIFEESIYDVDYELKITSLYEFIEAKHSKDSFIMDSTDIKLIKSIIKKIKVKQLFAL